jgi:hypothetical protein
LIFLRSGCRGFLMGLCRGLEVCCEVFLSGDVGVFVCFCAGVRVMPWCFTRCPCAGRHLLFFAAAKKSRQKKAAHTASSSICLRAPKRSYASHGSLSVRARCQRSLCTPHPLHVPAPRHAAPDSSPPPRWQTVCRLSRLSRLMRFTPD